MYKVEKENSQFAIYRKLEPEENRYYCYADYIMDDDNNFWLYITYKKSMQQALDYIAELTKIQNTFTNLLPPAANF